MAYGEHNSTALEGKVGLVGFSFSSVELPGTTVQKEVAEHTGGFEFSAFPEATLSLSSFKEDEAIGSPRPRTNNPVTETVHSRSR